MDEFAGLGRGVSRRRLMQLAGAAGAGAVAGARLPRAGAAQTGESFPDVELTAALIGGGSYDELYTQLDAWQTATGASVDTSTRLAHAELNDKLRKEYASGSPTFNWASDHTIFWPEWQIALEPLNAYLDEADLADYTPSVLAACTGTDGGIYAVPRHVDAQLMYYRTDLFEDPAEQEAFKARYGYDLVPPTTWDQWRDAAEFFTRPPDLFGFSLAGVPFAPMLLSAGGQLLDDDMKPAWNSDAGKQALGFLVDLYQVRKSVPEGALAYGWDDVTQLFRTGKVAFYFEWPGWYQQLKDPAQSEVVGKFGIAPQPVGPGGAEALRTGQGSHAFTIPKEADEKEASASAIRWITSPESEFYEFVEGGFLPVRSSVWTRVKDHVAQNGDELDKTRLALLEQTIAANFWTPPSQAIPQYISITTESLDPYMERAALGEISVEEALAESAEATEQAFIDNGIL